MSRRGHCRTLPSSSARDCPARGQRSKTTRRSDVKSWTRARSTATSTTPTVRRVTSSRWGSSRGGPVLQRLSMKRVPSASTSTSSPTANCLPPRPPSPVPPTSPDLAQVTSPAEPDVASHANNGTPQAGSLARQNDQIWMPPPVRCRVAVRVHIGGYLRPGQVQHRSHSVSSMRRPCQSGPGHSGAYSRRLSQHQRSAEGAVPFTGVARC